MLLEIARTSKDEPLGILASLANRHGLISGATGTGKTVSLQALAQKFSNAGVPVFVADVKGDLAGIAVPGTLSEKMSARLKELALPLPTPGACPTIFWDVYGEKGHPVRSTLSELGPALLSRLMGLNDTQASVLQVLFKVADDAGLLLIDFKDVNALIKLVMENLSQFKEQYGHLSPASIGTIQRALLTLESQGTKDFFGEPAFDALDLLQNSGDGRGYVHVLAADRLLSTPVVYSTFLLWLMSELFEQLPEVGDLEKPKLVFFFDEAHLLFKDAPKALVERIEQVVRLIRSKGVGIYFVTQSPLDIPQTVLGQLSHRIQHALRAFTPQDQKAVKVVADTFRQNPEFSAETAISQLKVGEALISMLDESGAPTVVERAFVQLPGSRLGPIDSAERAAAMAASPVAGHYEKFVDRVSAFETIASRTTASAPETSAATASAPAAASHPSVLNEILFGSVGPRGGRKAGLVEKAATSAARSVASSVGREIVRGLLGSIMGGSRPSRRR